MTDAAARPKIGLFLPATEGLIGTPWLPRWDEMRAIARTAEAVGFDSLLVPDHLILRGSAYWGIPETEVRGTWEAWTVLSALAAATERITLAPFVACSSFREPALLAKMADTLDEVSGGRLVLGLGSGSHPPEYAAFGYPYDHLAGRFEEALNIIVPLLRDGHVDFEGKYYRARHCELRPRGPRPHGPPIWIASFGPRMLRLAARWADSFITAWYPSAEGVAKPFAAFEAACGEVGRDPASVERTIGTFVTLPGPDGDLTGLRENALRGTPAEIAAGLRAFAAAGADHIVCMLDPRDTTGVERFAPVIEALRR